MDTHTILVALHLLGFAFGVGGATVSDAVFVRSVKDGKVTKEEYDTIKTISKVVWASVALLLISGAWLVYLEYLDFAVFSEIPRMSLTFFQLKVTAFAVLVVNGLVFHTRVFPLLKSTIGDSFRKPEIRKKYGLFAFTGGVSIASWYTAFLSVAFAGFVNELSYLLVANIYALLVLAAASGAYLVLNMHADESTPYQACRKITGSSYVKKVIPAGLLLVVTLIMQLV